MKVLLVGEFSGVHTNLKVGLESLGVETVLANTGDGFKRFSSDLLMRKDGKGVITKIQNYFLESEILSKMKKVDVVQIMHPNALSFYNSKKVFEVLDSANLVVQLLGGCDFVHARYFKHLDAGMCINCKKYDVPNHICPYTVGYTVQYEKEFYRHVDVMVPLCWEYEYMYRHYMPGYKRILYHEIPMPIDIGGNNYKRLENKKVKVLHSLNRVGSKGTREIKKAFDILKKEYGDIAEFHIKGKMPIEEYKRYLAKMDIVVDQLYGSTLGMNALYSLSMGKVVFTGNTDERMFLDYPYLKELPVYRLGYTTEDMVDNISRVICLGNFESKKLESRQYVEKYHDSKKIAEQYLELYEKYLERNRRVKNGGH